MKTKTAIYRKAAEIAFNKEQFGPGVAVDDACPKGWPTGWSQEAMDYHCIFNPDERDRVYGSPLLSAFQKMKNGKNAEILSLCFAAEMARTGDL